MSYLKIYPKRIFATLSAYGSFEGVFTLQIEQYGLQANDKKCDVKITQENDRLQIRVQPISGLHTPQFKQFTESLNRYQFHAGRYALHLPKVNVYFLKSVLPSRFNRSLSAKLTLRCLYFYFKLKIIFKSRDDDVNKLKKLLLAQICHSK